MATAPIPTPAPAAGAAPAMAGGAPPDAMGAAGDEGAEGAEPNVLFTVMADSPSGPFTLVAGDEPEGEGAMAADAPKFDTAQELMRAIMALLSNSGAAENSFAKGFKGEDDPTAAKPDMAAPGL